MGVAPLRAGREDRFGHFLEASEHGIRPTPEEEEREAPHAPAPPQALPKPRVVEQDVPQPPLHDLGVQRLRAHQDVGVEGLDDGVRERGLQVGGVGELLLCVVRGLLGQDLEFEQFFLDDVVRSDQARPRSAGPHRAGMASTLRAVTGCARGHGPNASRTRPTNRVMWATFAACMSSSRFSIFSRPTYVKFDWPTRWPSRCQSGLKGTSVIG